MANLKRVTSLVTEPITSDYHKVPTFANNTARDAAIPTPIVGMLIYNTGSGAVQQYNGTWSTIAPAPIIENVSGFLNLDTDSIITVFGTNFTTSSIIKMFDAASGGSQVGSNATTVFVSVGILKATFGAGSIPAAGTAVYIEVDNVGATNRFATGITVNADPTVTHAGATGTGSNTTTHLGTYGGLSAGGPSDSATKTLINFDQPGGVDIEDSSNIDDNGHKIDAVGQVQIEASPFGDGKSAIRFDGTDDMMTAPAHADWTFGSGDATVEFWFHPTKTTGVQRLVSCQGGTYYWILWWDRVDNKVSINCDNVTEIHSEHAYALNAWHHFAFVRVGTSAKVYVDGVLGIDTTVTGAMNNPGSVLAIGRYEPSASEGFEGWMDEIRIVKGTAVYTGNFTPPTTRLTAITNTVFLLHSNIAAQAGATGAISMNVPPHYATNADTSNQWQSNVAGSASSWWIDFGKGVSHHIRRINYTTLNSTSYVHSGAGTIKGSNDGYNYTTIHNLTFPHTGTPLNIDIASNAAYRYIKFSSPGSANEWPIKHCIFYTHNGSAYVEVPQAGLNQDTMTDVSSSPHTITKTSQPFHAGAQRQISFMHGHGGIAPAMTWPASGKRFGSAGAYLDGDISVGGDRVQVKTAPTCLTTTANSTIEFWWWSTGNDGEHQTLFRSENVDGGSSGQRNIRFYINGSNGNLTAYHLNGNAYVQTSPNSTYHVTGFRTAYPPGQWWHLAFTHTSGGTAALYMNGKYVATTNSGSDARWTGALHSTGGGEFCFGGGGSAGEGSFEGYMDQIRISDTIKYTGTDTSAFWSNFDQPTTLPGAILAATLPTITFTGAATQLAADEDIEFTDVANTTKSTGNQKFSDYGLTIANLTGGNKNKATLTGTITSAAGTTHSNMAVKAQVRKTLSENTYNNSTTVTFTGTTTTAGLAPGMPVTGTGISVAGPLTCGLTNTDATVTAASTTGLVVGMQVNAFTGVPAGATILSIITNTSFELSANATATNAAAVLSFNTIIASVDSVTVITLSNITTSGAQTNNDLIFEDLTRVHHINGTDVMDGTQAMMTIGTAAGGDPVLFNARRYIGNGDPARKTGFGFFPDMVWVKKRDGVEGSGMYDSVRGSVNRLFVNTNQAHATSGGATSIDIDGFTTSDGYGMDAENNKAYIAWAWKAGGAPTGVLAASGQTAFGSNSDYNGLTTGAGTIHNSATGVTNATSITQSVNQTSGFSITKFAGASGGVAFPHNLGGTPAFILIKSTTGAYDWETWHQNLSAPAAKFLRLNENSAELSDVNKYATAPSSTLIGPMGPDHSVGGPSGGTLMCYAWKAVTGVSHFGTYEGTGAGMTETGIGFTPSFLLIKDIDATNNWIVYDKFRGFGSSGNTDGSAVYANLTNAENASEVGITVSDGQFVMSNNNANVNTNGNTYIYAAFA